MSPTVDTSVLGQRAQDSWSATRVWDVQAQHAAVLGNCPGSRGPQGRV